MKNTILNEMFVKWQPSSPEKAVKEVMGACIKDLTGLFVYTTYCMGRANQMKNGMQQGTSTTLRLAEPLMEEIMDAKKKLQDLTPLFDLANGLTQFVSGHKLQPSIFFPFIGEDVDRTLLTREICENTDRLEIVRQTSTGTLIASGRNLQVGLKTVVGQMGANGTTSETLLRRLIQDASGEKPFVIVQEPSTPKEKQHLKWVIDWTQKGVKALFTSITCEGKPVFHVKEILTNKAGNPTEVCVRMDGVWLKVPVSWTIRVNLPEVFKVTPEGHCDVVLPIAGSEQEPKHRFFRPSYTWRTESSVSGRTESMRLEGIAEFLKLAIADGAIALANRKIFKSSAGKRVQEAINQAIRYAVNTLPVVEGGVKNASDTVWSSEFNLVVPGTKRCPDILNPLSCLTVVEEWKIKERMLTELAAQGFCVNATSKGKPGTIVTRVGELGIPDYVLQISPFARRMELKRLPEMREIATALDLVDAPELTLSTQGFPLSSALTGRVKELTVAVFDCNLNVFEDEIEGGAPFCHDTLLGCPSLKEKTRVKNLRFACTDEDKVEYVKTRLLDQGFTEEQLDIEERCTDLGNGLIGKAYEVRVTVDVEDIGKIKSLGAIKGVPTMLPYQLYAVDAEGNRREIDVVIPQTTFTKKNCLDAALYMAAAKQGKQEIDPAAEVELDSLPELRETVVAVYEDGEEEEIGSVIVGVLPFYRPVQTGLGLFAVRDNGRGIRVPLHVMPLLNLKHRVSKGVEASFAEKLACYQDANTQLAVLKDQMKKK